MGVCPQHDVLFDVLTVREHLDIFAIFKGINEKERKNTMVTTTIKDVDLEHK